MYKSWDRLTNLRSWFNGGSSKFLTEKSYRIIFGTFFALPISLNLNIQSGMVEGLIRTRLQKTHGFWTGEGEEKERKHLQRPGYQ